LKLKRKNEIMLLLLIIYFALSLCVFSILVLINSKKENRWKQFYNLPVFSIILILGIVLFNEIKSSITKLLDLLELHLDVDIADFHESYFFLFFFLILIVFTFSLLKPLIRLIPFRFIPVQVYFLENNNYYLKDNIILFRDLLKVLFVINIIITISLFILYYYIPNLGPFYSLITMMFCAEAWWHLNGNTRIKAEVTVPAEPDIRIEDAITKNEGQFEAIYRYFTRHKRLKDEKKIITAQKIHFEFRKDNADAKYGYHLFGESALDGDKILTAGNYSLIEPYLLDIIKQVIYRGRNILILGPFWNISYKNVNKEMIPHIYYEKMESFFSRIIQDLAQYGQGSAISKFTSVHPQDELETSIVISSSFDLLHSKHTIQRNIHWFENLELIVFENVSEQIVLNRIAQSTFSNIVKSINPYIKSIFLSSEFHGLEEGIRSTFIRQGNIPECPYHGSFTDLGYFINWRNELNSLQNILYSWGTNDYAGSIPLLIFESLKQGQTSYMWTTTYNEPNEDYCEELMDAARAGSYSDYSLIPKTGDQTLVQFIKDETKPFQLVNDHYNNASNLIYRLMTLNNKVGFYNITSNPYLFRDYFFSNLHYFSIAHLHPIAPKIDQTDPRNKLIILFECLKKNSLTNFHILELFNLDPGDDLLEYLGAKYKEHFDYEIRTFFL